MTPFETVFERRYIYPMNPNDSGLILNNLSWVKQMFDSTNFVFYPSDLTKEVSNRSKTRSMIDTIIQPLSQKVMKNTWDNQEDEFWNTY